MLGTSPYAKGGISTVIDSYKQDGLFERWPIVHIITHIDGNSFQKAEVAIKGLLRFIRLIINGQVLFVHVHAASYGSFWRKTLFIFISFARKCPIIFHLHGGRFLKFYSDCGSLKKKLIRLVLNRVAHIIVLSDRWKTDLAKITSNRNISCVSNAVADESLFEIERNKRKQGLFLFLGFIQHAKGAFDLLEAFARILGDFLYARLVYAGEGEIEELMVRARSLGIIDSIECLGWVNGETRHNLLTNAEVLVLPSYAEGLPMVVLEAMAAEIAVIATAVGGIPDVIEDGATGLLIEPGDINHLAAAMKRLLEDPDLCEKLGRTARRKALTHFSLHKTIPALEDIYRQVTENIK